MACLLSLSFLHIILYFFLCTSVRGFISLFYMKYRTLNKMPIFRCLQRSHPWISAFIIRNVMFMPSSNYCLIIIIIIIIIIILRNTDIFKHCISLAEIVHFIMTNYWSRDSAVGIATGYGMDDRGAGVRVR
jgi:hypothetical protein